MQSNAYVYLGVAVIWAAVGCHAHAFSDDERLAPVDEKASFFASQIVVKFAEQPEAIALGNVETVLGPNVQWQAPRHAPHAKGMPDQPHPLSYWRLAIVEPQADVVALSAQVSALPGIVFAGPNSRPEPTHVPNDPMYPQQWSHQKISSEGAWDVSTGNSDIIVGIIDTGCLISHEDLQALIWVNDDPPNGIDDDGNGFVDDTYGWNFANNNNNIDDVNGHGTPVSGISSAVIDNGVGVAGIANLTIMTSKWWHFTGSDFSVSESIFYAVDNGAHVLNLSLGCPCQLPMTEDAVNFAYNNGVVVVAAAGNFGSSGPFYPAWYPNVMAVAAITINDTLAGFSNWGPELDVGAPSPGILAPSNKGVSSYTPDFGGTSAASPHVAGLAGLVLSVNPTLTPDEVRTFINENADDLGEPGFDEFFGNGRINSDATIAAVNRRCPADLDGDGSVGASDLLALLVAWGTDPEGPPDFDGDGVVGASDLLTLLVNWGPCP
ncbi:MAG: S8 family serine peptidase [Phycisphaerales bacterium]